MSQNDGINLCVNMKPEGNMINLAEKPTFAAGPADKATRRT